MRRSNIKLVVFDLDGTLTRGETICEVIARQIGQIRRMKELEQAKTIDELRIAREEMAEWYRPYSVSELCSFLKRVTIAPGTPEAFQLLREQGLKTAIVSITWEFAVEWFARQFGADFYVGTKLLSNGQIKHFWAQDKAQWIKSVMLRLGLTPKQVAAVGDSSSDLQMLKSMEQGFFVGKSKPVSLGHVIHVPNGNINEIAQAIIYSHDKGRKSSVQEELHLLRERSLKR